MASPAPNLKILDTATSSRDLDLASELFHRINRIIPKGQKVLTVGPTERVRDAVSLMQKHGYSQIPVMKNGEVLGVFSYRSFAKEAATTTLEQWRQQKCAPGDLPVDEFLERFQFARVTEEMSVVFDGLERDNGILIGSPDRLMGILTPADVLKYLHHVASPFVWLSEIERSLRALIRLSLSEEQIAAAAKQCLASRIRAVETVPTSLEEMNFADYQTLLSHGDNWLAFEPVFGGNRTRLSGKLKQIGGIRNDVFHFKRLLSNEEYEVLWTHREWLHNKIKQVNVPGRGEPAP